MKNKKLLLVISLIIAVIGLTAAFLLSRNIARFKTPAVTPSVDVYIEPSTQSLPPDSNFKIYIDSKGAEISAARINFVYDRTKVELVGDVVTTPLMSDVVEYSVSEHGDGSKPEDRVTMALAVPPGRVLPSGIFEFASFNIKSISTLDNDAMSLYFYTQDMQIVDVSEVQLIINAREAQLTLNPKQISPTVTVVPSPTSTVSLTPTKVPTSTPTKIITLTPTISPTPAQAISCVNAGGICRVVCQSTEKKVTTYSCSKSYQVCCIK